MTTMRRDPLVDDYLRRLKAAAAGLPRERRAELVGEIEEHVDAALREAGTEDETAVRNVLERLGSPEEIAAAARPPSIVPERGWLETAALIVLAVSFLLPVAGYLIGAGLVPASKAWDGREKTIGLLIPPIVVLAGALVVVAAAASAGGSTNVGEEPSADGGLGPLELAVAVLSGFMASAYLASRLRRPTAG